MRWLKLALLIPILAVEVLLAGICLVIVVACRAIGLISDKSEQQRGGE